MKIFKELKKLGYKHYTEHTVEELDNLPLESKERIMEQALVLRWFRKKHNLKSCIIMFRTSMADNEEYYDWLIKGEEVVYRHFKTYEEAEKECLIKLIEIVKNNYGSTII